LPLIVSANSLGQQPLEHPKWQFINPCIYTTFITLV